MASVAAFAVWVAPLPLAEMELVLAGTGAAIAALAGAGLPRIDRWLATGLGLILSWLFLREIWGGHVPLDYFLGFPSLGFAAGAFVAALADPVMTIVGRAS